MFKYSAPSNFFSKLILVIKEDVRMNIYCCIKIIMTIAFVVIRLIKALGNVNFLAHIKLQIIKNLVDTKWVIVLI